LTCHHLMNLRSPRSTLLPYTTLFRSRRALPQQEGFQLFGERLHVVQFDQRGTALQRVHRALRRLACRARRLVGPVRGVGPKRGRSEEHTSELQSREKLVCRLLLEKKK